MTPGSPVDADHWRHRGFVEAEQAVGVGFVQPDLATTVLRGRRVLRININSVLTRAEHVDELRALLQREGATVAQEPAVDRGA